MTGSELRQRRTCKGITLREVAKESGVAVSYISVLESDERVQEYRQRVAETIDAMEARQFKRPGRRRKWAQEHPAA